jgi:demethylmenaquinone methyltransferase/2-methoxy-6-polyprenyl-1,4-benzoquinol methylase
MTANRHTVCQKKSIRDIFNDIPPRYDLVNDIVTWGLDRRWRRLAARECISSQPEKVLDLCCGTGGLALNIARLAGNNVEITGLDFSRPMLEIAARKVEKAGHGNKILLQYGDAAGLPYPDSYFDVIGISFAFRNLTYQNPQSKQYLVEIQRALRPGGRLVIVETSQPRSGIVRWLFHLYLRSFVSFLGLLLSGNRGAYQYLVDSVSDYYTPAELRQLLSSAGLRDVVFRPLFPGVSGICIAIK